jgi:hypothetical protein
LRRRSTLPSSISSTTSSGMPRRRVMQSGGCMQALASDSISTASTTRQVRCAHFAHACASLPRAPMGAMVALAGAGAAHMRELRMACRCIGVTVLACLRGLGAGKLHGCQYLPPRMHPLVVFASTRAGALSAVLAGPRQPDAPQPIGLGRRSPSLTRAARALGSEPPLSEHLAAVLGMPMLAVLGPANGIAGSRQRQAARV